MKIRTKSVVLTSISARASRSWACDTATSEAKPIRMRMETSKNGAIAEHL